jgi:hypothetical protein
MRKKKLTRRQLKKSKLSKKHPKALEKDFKPREKIENDIGIN